MSDDKIVLTIDADLEDLIPGFLENRSRDIVTLREALGKDDFPAIQSLGHSLKGVGGGYGFDEITNIGMALENAAKSQNREEISVLITNYADYLDRIEITYE